MMKLCASVKITPEMLADEFWKMKSDEQAVFYQELFKLAGSQKLVLQGLEIREECKKLSSESIDGFQYLSSCSFQFFESFERKGMWG